jgi:hypothetical protein
MTASPAVSNHLDTLEQKKARQQSRESLASMHAALADKINEPFDIRTRGQKTLPGGSSVRYVADAVRVDSQPCAGVAWFPKRDERV